VPSAHSQSRCGEGAGAGSRRSRNADLMSRALLLFPARSAGREHRFSLGGFPCFSRRLLGQPSRLGFFPGSTRSFASLRLGSLPGGQLGRLLFPGCASGRLPSPREGQTRGDERGAGEGLSYDNACRFYLPGRRCDGPHKHTRAPRLRIGALPRNLLAWLVTEGCHARSWKLDTSL
jgi:hypothetical protein